MSGAASFGEEQGVDGGVAAARVLIAHHRAPVRAALRASLDGAGFHVCTDAVDGPDAVAVQRTEHPDVAIVHVNLPPSGLEVARELLRGAPDVPVVLVGDIPDDAQLFAALEVGVSGYLLDDIDTSRVPRAIRAVLAGETALPRRLVTRVVREFGARASLAAATNLGTTTLLSRREAQVLQLLAAQRSTAEIADALYISRVTVRTHVSAILKKLDVPDRASAIETFGVLMENNT